MEEMITPCPRRWVFINTRRRTFSVVLAQSGDEACAFLDLDRGEWRMVELPLSGEDRLMWEALNKGHGQAVVPTIVNVRFY